MKPLTPPDSHHLRAAEGWLELGNHLEANAELEKIKPKLRSHFNVLLVRLDIYEQAKKWDEVVDIAQIITKRAPVLDTGWIRLAYAFHELERTQEAFDALMTVADNTQKLWRIPYNLSCYCAQLGRLEDSKTWFKKAMLLDEKTVQRISLDDPDLKPLWDSMSGTMWKRSE